MALAMLLLAIVANRQSDQAAALAAEYMAYKTGPYSQLMEIRQASGGNAMGLVGIVFLLLLAAGIVAGILALKARADREARLLKRAKATQSARRAGAIPSMAHMAPPTLPANVPTMQAMGQGGNTE